MDLFVNEISLTSSNRKRPLILRKASSENKCNNPNAVLLSKKPRAFSDDDSVGFLDEPQNAAFENTQVREN